MIKTSMNRILKPTHGAALVEYGLLVGLISTAAIFGVTDLGEKIETSFNTSSAAIETALNTGGSSTGGGTGGAPIGGGSTGGGGGGGGGGASDGFDPIDTSGCEVVPAMGDTGPYNYIGQDPAPTCYSLDYSAGVTGWEFSDGDTTPLYVSGNSVGDSLIFGQDTVTGMAADSTVIVTSTNTNFTHDGQDGFDVLAIPVLSSTSVVWTPVPAGTEYNAVTNSIDHLRIKDGSNLDIDIGQCSPEVIVFSDVSMTRNAYASAAGFSCPSNPTYDARAGVYVVCSAADHNDPNKPDCYWTR
ncbi:Flp family type IVb pilin [Loktanella sp. DJP18]|uniref:Flp family type IVb pilin n=1 Tax=Loktanella sp. DJP18 TaxID=3409788 RepID=UPI003BB4CA99